MRVPRQFLILSTIQRHLMIRLSRATALLLAACLCSCAAKTTVHQVTPATKLDGSAVFYNLPRTVCIVEIPVTRTTVRTGSLEEYTSVLTDAGINVKAATRDEVSYAIGDVRLTSRAEPDPSALFAVDLDQQIYETKSLTMQMTSDGMLANSEPMPPTTVPSNAITTIESIAYPNADESAPVSLEDAKQHHARQHTQPKANDQALAEKLRDEILELRKRRLELISGRTLPVDAANPGAITILLDAMRNMEEKLLSKFVGTKKMETWTAYCEFVPTTEGKQFELLRLSEKGIVQTTAMNPTPENFETDDGSQPLRRVFITVRSSAPEAMEQIRNAAEPLDSVGGFYYRIAAASTVEITLKAKTTRRIAFLNLPVAQFGLVACLPRSVRMSPDRALEYYTSTGSLKRFQMGDRATDSTSVLASSNTLARDSTSLPRRSKIEK